MKTQHILIARHFLEILRNHHEETEHIAKVRTAFIHLLTREELLAILERVYLGEAQQEHPNLLEKTNPELLEIIKDQYYILDYFIDELLEEFLL